MNCDYVFWQRVDSVDQVLPLVSGPSAPLSTPPSEKTNNELSCSKTQISSLIPGYDTKCQTCIIREEMTRVFQCV